MGVKCWDPVLLNIKLFEETANYELFDKAPFEKLDLRFCKSLLRIHKKSSNIATRGELGRYPIIIWSYTNAKH